MDSGIECTLSRCADHSRLCGAVDTLEGSFNAIQRDPDSFEKWASADLIKLNKAECKVLHMAQFNPTN